MSAGLGNRFDGDEKIPHEFAVCQVIASVGESHPHLAPQRNKPANYFDCVVHGPPPCDAMHAGMGVSTSARVMWMQPVHQIVMCFEVADGPSLTVAHFGVAEKLSDQTGKICLVRV